MSISLTINDIQVQAEPGSTVLQAAQAHGIYIPTLCYMPQLRPAGACRMCVVEIEQLRGYPTACTVPVSEGMVVRTETETVRNLRRETLALILSEHPYTCLVCSADCGLFHCGTIRKAAVTTGCQYCPANHQCELQTLVDYLDIQELPYPINYRGLPVENEDPFFDRDYNLCVLCGRCVRVCQEVRHVGALAFVNRGSHTIVGTAFGNSHLDTNCEFCGSCVDICPTGALADKRGKWEGAPTATVSSVCPYCSVGCAVQTQVKNNKVIRTIGLGEGLTNEGQLCKRGRFGVVDVVHNPTRLKAPLVRRNDRLVEVSWDEALAVVTDKLGHYRQSSAFAAVASATATNEENYLLQKFTRTMMGSNNIALAAGFPDHDESLELAYTLKDLAAPAIREVRQADCIVVIGANLYESHPILGLEVRHALSEGASVLNIDTRRTDLAKTAAVWLQPQVGTDHLLLAGIMAHMNVENSAFSGLDLAQVSQITGVAPEMITRAAHLLGEHRTGRTFIIYGSGVTHHPPATQVIKAIRSLAYALNAGVIGVMGEGNFVGSHDMGLHPALLPGYNPVADPAARAKFEQVWGASLNPEPGPSYEQIVEGVRQGQIKALWLAGEMPPLPELANLEFLLVQDIVEMEALQYAHVVLPTVTFAEQDGTLTNLEGRVQRLTQAIPPFKSACPGWLIIREVAKRLGASWSYGSASEVMAEIAQVVPAYSAVSYDTLDVKGYLRRFEPASGPQLMPFSLDHIPHFASEAFPLTLLTERNLLYYHGACLTEQVDGMNLVKQEEILHLNPLDVERLGLADGRLAKVVSAYGSADCVVKAAADLLPQGAAFISFNRINSSTLFPHLAPSAKAYGIRVEVLKNGG
jgi:predicted molibdopterin-dependent oxidoreductase YjgC